MPRGRPTIVDVTTIQRFKVLAAIEARELVRRGVRPTPVRVLRRFDERRADADVSVLYDHYERDTLKAFVREILPMADRGDAPSIPKKTYAWVRARLGQNGHKDLVSDFDDDRIASLVRRARRAPRANFDPEETALLWILRERELIPLAAVDPSLGPQPNLEEVW